MIRESLKDTLPDGVVPHINPRARRLSLKVDSVKGHIRLVIPPHCSLRKATGFARQHEAWIQDQRQRLQKPAPFEHGLKLSVLGRQREIIQDRNPIRGTKITLERDHIRVMTRRNTINSAVSLWLKTLAYDHFTERLREKADRLNAPYPIVEIRDPKSRWGSCSEDGRIMLSWRLLLAPTHVMDYVIAHEAAHLRHMNHGPDFWSLCATLANQDIGPSQRWLKENGAELFRYGRST